MVQEVQTWVWITNETTLETIEAIGTSSFKIREWRQTTWHYSSWCTATGQVYFNYQSWGSRDSWEIKSWNTTITSMTWKQEFVMSNGWVRVPVAWTYEITLTWGCGSYTHEIIIKWWGKTLYSLSKTGSYSETVTFQADLWKFDTIEIWGHFYYSWSADAASMTFSTQPVLVIKQL